MNYLDALLAQFAKDTATYNAISFAEFSNGNSSSSKTIDLSAYQYHVLTLTADCTLSFVAPPSPASRVIRVVQDGTGGHNITWPSNVHAAGAALSVAGGANKATVYALYFDGTNYHVTAVVDSSGPVTSTVA